MSDEAPPSFDVETSVEGARTEVVLHGEIDAYTAPRLRQAFAELGDVAGRHVVVDMGDVGFVDSAGLSALVACFRSVQNADGALSLRDMTRQLTKLFEITGLNRLFPTE